MKFSPLLTLLILALFVMPSFAQSNGMALGNVKILEMSGNPALLSKSDGTSGPAQIGEFIQQGSKIKTSAESTVTLLLDNGSLVIVKPDTEFSIDRFVADPFDYEGVDYRTMTAEPSRSVTKLNVRSGEIFLDVVKLKENSKFDIVTPVGSAGIRGTKLSVGSNGIVVAEGSVLAQGRNGQTQTLGPNMGVSFRGNGFTPIQVQNARPIVQAILNLFSQIRPTLAVNPFFGAPTGGFGDETSDTGDQGTITAGQNLPGSGNRPPPSSR